MLRKEKLTYIFKKKGKYNEGMQYECKEENLKRLFLKKGIYKIRIWLNKERTFLKRRGSECDQS